jgi:hypothetical protein
MAFHLEKQKTTSTPYILIDEEKSYMRFEGHCFHEKVVDLFKDINEWLDSYLASDFETFTFDCEMYYFNSSTTKLLLNMLLKLDKHASAGKKIIVNWMIVKDNDIMIDSVESFKEYLNHMEFNLVLK